LWTHNDSGGRPRIFAVDSAGRAAVEVEVAGAHARDWEDIAMGPCPSGACLYIGDIGDNDAVRGEIVVYRVPEPEPGALATSPAESFAARYPGGPRDAEALFVLPSGEIYILTRGRGHPIELYRYPLPLQPGGTVVLERVRQISPGPVSRPHQVTGANATPDGAWVAVRTYRTLFLYRTADLLAGPETGARSVDLSVLGEPQGEGVAIRPDGQVVLTSEGVAKRTAATMSRLACTLQPGGSGAPPATP
ncbi:MAG: hypothetical protein M3409_04170, partial [Gemmatimonadota bacterium]|nr:hypothetical protein [Gemmatimonadota bacterium]